MDWGTSLDTLDAADRLDTLVNPGIPVPPDVTAPTGITDADVVDAPPIAQVTSGIREHWTSTGPTGASDGPGQAATHGLARGILAWDNRNDHRVRVAVPALAGTGVGGSLVEAIHTAATGKRPA